MGERFHWFALPETILHGVNAVENRKSVKENGEEVIMTDLLPESYDDGYYILRFVQLNFTEE